MSVIHRVTPSQRIMVAQGVLEYAYDPLWSSR